ncbi:hypothetical protein GGX14DRAFT_324517, partial [Mycena pura]
LPDFRFNVEGAVLGVLNPVPSITAPDSVLLPHSVFLATRYLPCGYSDQPIQKFTGNTDCGEVPTDRLTTAIHAYSHWTIRYTNGCLAICDLQVGMRDRKGDMVLIDPQAHTYVVSSV